AAARAAGDARERALARVREAMRRWPRATGGTGRLSTELMERTGSRLVAKGGAEGLECVALPERGRGLAIKCEDGQSRGIGPALVGLLEQLGVLGGDEIARLAELRRPVIRNHAGVEAGAFTADFKVLEPSR
ncbi:MAG TPA: asparaginase, partial [Candidatus Eisenbacteria bacterium]